MDVANWEIVEKAPYSIIVIATYPDKAAADAAAEKAAALRAPTQEDIEGEVTVTM